MSMALGSSLKLLEMDKPNVLRCTRPYPLGFFISYLNNSMSCTINLRSKINTLIFLNFFIVPPPPKVGRDEPNNTLMTLSFIIAQN